MKQAELGLNLRTKKTREREFLGQMERVVPWAALVALVAPYAPEGKKGRPPFAVQTMLRIHFMQQWFTLSDPSIESTPNRRPAAVSRVRASGLQHPAARRERHLALSPPARTAQAGRSDAGYD
jgi:hypothetical protein